MLMLVYTDTQPPRIEQLFGGERIIEMANALNEQMTRAWSTVR